jgi:cytochrome P450
MTIKISQITNRPSHVPAHLVHEFSSYFSGSSQEVTEHWKSLHKSDVPEIFWTPAFGGHWVATRAEDIEHIYKNFDSFTSKFGISLPLRPHPEHVLPIFCDPPEHGEYRRVASLFFNPKKVNELKDFARNLAINVIESLIDKGECEFYGEYAQNQPVQLFLKLAGRPFDDWKIIQPLAELAVRGGDTPEASAAVEKAWAYLMECVIFRRLNPGDDPFTGLVQAEVFGGRKLTDVECAANANTILFGGLDTTPATVTSIAHFLATHPEHRRRLVEDSSLIPTACEEFLRRFPATTQGRCVRNDMVYQGVEMKAGEYILIPGILANLDDRRFPDPLSVDFGRADVIKSVTFGAGIHRCPGSYLARMQIQIFLEEWLKRIPDFGIAKGKQEHIKCGATMAMVNLPLAW